MVHDLSSCGELSRFSRDDTMYSLRPEVLPAGLLKSVRQVRLKFMGNSKQGEVCIKHGALIARALLAAYYK